MKTYVCSTSNTKIRGTIVTTKCPLCKFKVAKNFSAFLYDQTHDVNNMGMPGLDQARRMIALGQLISNEVNDDTANAIRKKKKQ